MIRLPPALHKFFGVEGFEDDVIDDAVARIKTRLAAVDLSMYRRKPAQARLEIEGVEAAIGSLRDHYPNSNFAIRTGWPTVHVTLKGQSARVELWLGLDLDQGDGIEPFDVMCPTFQPPRDFGSVVRKMMDRLATRRPEPEMVLRQPAPKPAAPVVKVEPVRKEPARATPSRRRQMMERK